MYNPLALFARIIHLFSLYSQSGGGKAAIGRTQSQPRACVSSCRLSIGPFGPSRSKGQAKNPPSSLRGRRPEAHPPSHARQGKKKGKVDSQCFTTGKAAPPVSTTPCPFFLFSPTLLFFVRFWRRAGRAGPKEEGRECGGRGGDRRL